jgi:hypothetical protein
VSLIDRPRADSKASPLKRQSVQHDLHCPPRGPAALLAGSLRQGVRSLMPKGPKGGRLGNRAGGRPRKR